jgi:hypothetical protein
MIKLRENVPITGAAITDYPTLNLKCHENIYGAKMRRTCVLFSIEK